MLMGIMRREGDMEDAWEMRDSRSWDYYLFCNGVLRVLYTLIHFNPHNTTRDKYHSFNILLYFKWLESLRRKAPGLHVY